MPLVRADVALGCAWAKLTKAVPNSALSTHKPPPLQFLSLSSPKPNTHTHTQQQQLTYCLNIYVYMYTYVTSCVMSFTHLHYSPLRTATKSMPVFTSNVQCSIAYWTAVIAEMVPTQITPKMLSCFRTCMLYGSYIK